MPPPRMGGGTAFSLPACSSRFLLCAALHYVSRRKPGNDRSGVGQRHHEEWMNTEPAIDSVWNIHSGMELNGWHTNTKEQL